MYDWKKEFAELFFYSTEKDAVPRAIALKDKHIPDNLFRYRQLNEFTFSELANGTVYIQNPSRFNDPYDSWIKLSLLMKVAMAPPDEVFRRSLSSHFSKELLEDIFDSPNWFNRLYDLVFSSSGFDVLGKVITPLFEEANLQATIIGHKMMKVCCFTETNVNLAMWAHYSTDFLGVCIEYDMTAFPHDDIRRVRLFPVLYDKGMIDYTERFSGGTAIKRGDVFLESSLHKLCDWEYEKEWRFVIGNGLVDKDANFNFSAIKSVYVGYRVSDEHYEMLLSIAKCKRYALKKMKIMSYGLDFETIFDPNAK